MNEKVLDMDDMVGYIYSRLQELGDNTTKATLDLIFDLEYEYLHENGYTTGLEGDIY